MRILHATQYFLPWIGYQEYYLARQQLQDGHNVLVASSNLRWRTGNYAALQERGVDQRMAIGHSVEFEIPTARLPVLASWNGRVVLGNLRRIIEEFRPDVIHSHLYLVPLTFQLARLRRDFHFRLVVDEHQLPHQAVKGSVHKIQRRATALVARRLVLPSVDALVAVADGARDWLAEEYGCPRSRITVIPLGVDSGRFRPDESAGSSVRHTLGIQPATFLIVYSGKIAAHKGIDTLIRAVARIEAGSPAILLVGHAEPDTLEQLRSLAEGSDVRLFVQAAVPTDKLYQYFNAADVCVWPADCTISHLEAAACGKPIIIPNEPGIADRISAGNGVGVAIGDVNALVNALRHLMSDPEIRKRMGDSGRESMLRHYSWKAIAREFELVYTNSAPLASTR